MIMATVSLLLSKRRNQTLEAATKRPPMQPLDYSVIDPDAGFNDSHSAVHEYYGSINSPNGQPLYAKMIPARDILTSRFFFLSMDQELYMALATENERSTLFQQMNPPHFPDSPIPFRHMVLLLVHYRYRRN